MEFKFGVTNIKKTCIILIIIPLIILMAYSSFALYYSPENYWNNDVYSSGTQSGFIFAIISLSSIACTVLFILTILDENIVKNTRFIFYFFIIISMLFVLIFNTNDVLYFLRTPGLWVERMSLITVFACSIFFCAYNDMYWQFINKVLMTCVIIMFVMVTWFLFSNQEIYTDRLYAFKWLHGFGVIIRLCPFIFLMQARNLFEKYTALGIIIIDILMIISLQTRLYVVDFAIYSILITFLIIKNIKTVKTEINYRFVKKVRAFVLLVFMFFVFTIFYINFQGINLDNQSVFSSSIMMFSERLFTDTRTEQIDNFMSVFWREFPFGVGYNTTNINSGLGLNGIDNGYLNTIYLVGLPMTIFLMFFTIRPIIQAWKINLTLVDIAVVARATTWIIILTSSTTTSYNIEFIYFIICAGRCAGLVDKSKNKQVLNKLH